MEIIEFKNYGLKLKLTPFINIIGSASSGKTHLLKMLINKVPNNDLFIDNVPVINYSLDYKKRNLTVCFNDLTFNKEYVNEELMYYQSLLGFKKEISYLEVKNFEKYFNLKELIDIKIEYLTTEEAALIKILSFLIIKPSVLGLDNILSYLSIENKLKVLKYAKKNEVVILNVTSMSDELLLGTDIAVLDKYKVVKYSKTNEILNDDKLLLEIGFEPPFATSLSQGLNYYDLLDKKYHNNKSLVEAIWK